MKIDLLLDLGRIDKAKNIINIMQNIGYDKFKDYNIIVCYYYQGMIFYKSEDYINADKYWNMTIQNIKKIYASNKPNYVDTMYAVSNLKRGLCNKNLMRNDVAILFLDTALIWYKKYNEKKSIANCFYHKSYCYNNMSNIDMAIKMLDSSIKYIPDFYDAYISKGNMLQQLASYTDAINCYKKAIELNKDNYQAYYCLGYIYRNMLDYSQAVENFKKVCLLEPNNIDVLIELSKIYEEQNNKSDYLRIVKQIIAIDDENKYAQDFIIKHKLKKIYMINSGFVYDFTDMQ